MAADRVTESQQQHLSCADWRLQVTSALAGMAGSWQYCTNNPKISRVTIHIHSSFFKRCIHPLWIDASLTLMAPCFSDCAVSCWHESTYLMTHDAQNFAHSQKTNHRKAENLTSIVAIPPLSVSCQQPQEKPTVKFASDCASNAEGVAGSPWGCVMARTICNLGLGFRHSAE